MARLAVLLALALGIIAARPDYRRGDWMPGGWADVDGDCQDTRAEVLARTSLVPVVWDAAWCRVVTGAWIDPYSGEAHTRARGLDVDHLVPLAEAHRSGGHVWPAALKRHFANDLRDPWHLLPVGARGNRQKGDRDPAAWLPAKPRRRCRYVRWWLAVKGRYGLAMDGAEVRAVASELDACGFR